MTPDRPSLCPFCGSAASLDSHDGVAGQFVSCDDCGATAPSLAAWNRRAPASPQGESSAPPEDARVRELIALIVRLRADLTTINRDHDGVDHVNIACDALDAIDAALAEREKAS